MTQSLNELQLDALCELANVASAQAAHALSKLLGRETEITVPRALSLPLAEAVEACGDLEQETAGVVVGITGDLGGSVLLLFPPALGDRLCALFGVDPVSEVGESALREIGNILGAAYLGGLAAMTGLALLPKPPRLQIDMLGALVASMIAEATDAEDLALLLECELDVAGEACPISSLLLPRPGAVDDLLTPLGLGTTPAPR